jgi:hypothetical protein
LAAAHDPDARDVLCWREYRASFVCFYFFWLQITSFIFLPVVQECDLSTVFLFHQEPCFQLFSKSN